MVQVSAGGEHSLALTEDGHVLSWGHGRYGCLGHDEQEHQPLPKLVEALRGKKVLQISAGLFHSVVRLQSGEVRRTDQNASGGWACLPLGGE